MKPPKTVFVCQECGAQAPKWMGRCTECGAWNSLVEERTETPAASAGSNRFSQFSTSSTARLYAEVEMSQGVRLSTGIDEFDRVLGGGVVPGSLILLGGEPGIGKSTLLLQAAAHFARAGLGKSFWIVRYLPASGRSKLRGLKCPPYALERLWLDAQPVSGRLSRVAFATTVARQIAADMFMQVFIERGRRICEEAGYRPLILCGGRLS